MKRISALLALVGLLAGCPTTVTDPITAPPTPGRVLIGLIISDSTSQLERDQAARLAVEEINAAGGVNGQLLELRVGYDALNDPSAGVASAQRLRDEGVVAIIGANSSRVTRAIAEQVSIAAGLAVITHGGTSPLLTTLADNDTVYRIPPSDTLQGRLLAELAYGEGRGQVAILAQDEPYGRGLDDSFRQRFLALGGSIQAEAFYPPEQLSGFSAAIDTLYANGTPGALMLFGFQQSVAAFLRELLAARGSLPPLYGVDANMSPTLGTVAGPEVAGMRGTTPAPPQSPAYQYFANTFTGRTGQVPSANTENTYDAVYLVALALAAGGQNDRATVVANLRPVSRPDGSAPVAVGPGQFAQALAALQAGSDIDYQGASGAIDFDAAGDPTAASYSYMELRQNSDGSFSVVELGRFNL